MAGNYWTDRRLAITGDTSNGSRIEAEIAASRPDDICGVCGGLAQIRSSIGAYKCTRCGALRVNGVYR